MAVKVLLNDFQFVGLTEEFNLSALLYHRMFSESEAPSPCDQAFRISRPGKYNDFHGVSKRQAEQQLLSSGALRDDPDVLLHAAASLIFWQRVCLVYRLVPVEDPRCAGSSDARTILKTHAHSISYDA